MKTSKAALALIVAGAMIGCGSETTSNASAEAKSGAATSTASAPAGTAAAKPGEAGAAGAAKKEADAPSATAASGGSAIKYMPKDCDEIRVFADVSKVFGADTHAALESLIGKGVAEGTDPKKGEEVLKVLKDGGIEPSKALKQFAVCGNKDDAKTVVAAILDMGKAEKPADVLAKAIETGTGVAPKREELDGVPIMQSKDGKPWIAVVGKDALVVSENKDTLKAVLKGGDGASEFAAASGLVVWAKDAKGDVDVKVKEAGDDLDVAVRAKVGKDAPQAKEQFDKMQPELDKMTEKATVLKPLLPAGKNAKVTVDGEFLDIKTNFPKKAIGEALNLAKDMSLQDLEKQMRF